VSCEKEDNSITDNCKDCLLSWEALNGYDISQLNAGAQILGYASWDAYMNAIYTTGELCGEILEYAEGADESVDIDGDGTFDYRVFYDCN
tara:strand:+ start:347 stop:616 length:270 start_codon:yes stop_codon:yes gene_type:complete